MSRHSHRSGRSRSTRSGPESSAAPSAARKDLQLCRQVAETLHFALGDCGDDVLRDLHVVRVVPAPDASQLLVLLGSAPGEVPAAPAEVLERLRARSAAFRAEVARSITRKRAPALLFDYRAAPADGGPPE